MPLSLLLLNLQPGSCSADLLQIDQQNDNSFMNSFLNNMNSIEDTYTPLKKVNKYKLKFKTNSGLRLSFRNSFLLKTTY